MKSLALPALAGVLLAGTALAPTGANARQALSARSVERPTDVSTAKRQQAATRHHSAARHRPRIYGYAPGAYGYVAPTYGPPAYAYQGWRPADPTWGPGTPMLRYYQSIGRCVIDEGYGRYTFCSNQ